MLMILLVILLLLAVGALPSWRYSNAWGYGPSGGLGLLAVIIILVMLFYRY